MRFELNVIESDVARASGSCFEYVGEKEGLIFFEKENSASQQFRTYWVRIKRCRVALAS